MWFCTKMPGSPSTINPYMNSIGHPSNCPFSGHTPRIKGLIDTPPKFEFKGIIPNVLKIKNITNSIVEIDPWDNFIFRPMEKKRLPLLELTSRDLNVISECIEYGYLKVTEA